MKKRFKKTKRETLPKILIKSFSIAITLCLIFAYGFWEYERMDVRNQATNSIEGNISSIQSWVNRTEAQNSSRDTISELSRYLAKYVDFDIMFEDELSKNGGPQIVPRYSESNHALAAVVDKDNNIVANNLFTLQVFIKYDKDAPDNGYYICHEKNSIPEVQQLYNEYRQLAKEETLHSYVEMKLESAYVNKKDRTFIPHKGSMRLVKYDYDNVPANSEPEYIILRTKEIDININDGNYELLELGNISSKNYPVCALFNFWGEEQEVLDRYKDKFVFQDKTSYLSGGFEALDGDADYAVERCSPIYINKEEHFVYLRYIIKYTTPEFMKFYWKYVILFSLAVLAITALYCWRRNVVNKAKYAMDDYQRDLTNHLAHDIKTPLMAIGGYTENIMEVELTEDEKKQYLSAILDNIKFTDSIINKTLFLNSLEDGSEIKPEKINVETVVKDAIKKYEPILEEKGIKFTIEGNTEIKADKTSFENIIENLISNAVKYTAENGTVKAACERKKLIITNTVKEKVNVKDLKKPFVRGEKSRSNLGGSGLGLSIAERAAALNGFKLNISCTNTEFSAEIKY